MREALPAKAAPSIKTETDPPPASKICSKSPCNTFGSLPPTGMPECCKKERKREREGEERREGGSWESDTIY